MCRINCSGGCPECDPDSHEQMTPLEIMRFLTTPEGNSGFKTLISEEGTRYTICDDGLLYWMEKKHPKGHAVAGDGWACLFEDEVFYEVSQANLAWDLKNNKGL